MVFEYSIVRLEETGERILLTTGETTHACIDMNGRPVRLPQPMVDHLTGYWSDAKALVQTENWKLRRDRGQKWTEISLWRLIRVTEAAALSCSRLMGRGDKNKADEAAVAAMRRAFEALEINGTVVIGEGERDEAPMLYIGEKVGGDSTGPEVDIAVDPLEEPISVHTESQMRLRWWPLHLKVISYMRLIPTCEK